MNGEYFAEGSEAAAGGHPYEGAFDEARPAPSPAAPPVSRAHASVPADGAPSPAAASAPAPGTVAAPVRPAIPSIPGQAGAVWPDRPAVRPTGDERVDRLVSRLGELAGRPVAEHVAVYADLHQGLQEILAATGQEPAGQEPAGREATGRAAAGPQSAGHAPRPVPFPRPGPGPR